VATADGSHGPSLVPDREANAHFSPEHGGRPPRWFAYVGFESGRLEIYVRNFPQGDRKWRISTGGGLEPRWRADGRELFFLSPDGTLMAAEVSGDRDLNVGTPKALFQTGVRAKRGIHDIWGQDYAPSRDGQRFLINRRAGDGLTEPVTIIAPWVP
jgi:hypothetical protein